MSLAAGGAGTALQEAKDRQALQHQGRDPREGWRPPSCCNRGPPPGDQGTGRRGKGASLSEAAVGLGSQGQYGHGHGAAGWWVGLAEHGYPVEAMSAQTPAESTVRLWRGGTQGGCVDNTGVHAQPQHGAWDQRAPASQQWGAYTWGHQPSRDLGLAKRTPVLGPARPVSSALLTQRPQACGHTSSAAGGEPHVVPAGRGPCPALSCG